MTIPVKLVVWQAIIGSIASINSALNAGFVGFDKRIYDFLLRALLDPAVSDG
jgi:hypothetical protein